MNKKIFIIIIVVLSAGIAFYSIRGMITPYVTFKKAIETGKYVQIIGKLDPSEQVMHENGFFNFQLKDDNNISIKINYKGIKPANFESADQIVVLGIYDKSTQIFNADKMLVKCPSKYIKAN